MLDPIVAAFEKEVRKVQLREPRIPFISNVTGKWISSAEATDPTYWARHANHSARFSDALHHMWQLKNAILLEAGPGRTLGLLAMQHPDRTNAQDPVTIASLRHHYENQSDVEFVFRLWPGKHRCPFKSTPSFRGGFTCHPGNAFCRRPLAFTTGPRARKPGERGFSTPMTAVWPRN